MIDAEKLISEMNSGRMGQLAMSHLEPIFALLRAQHMAELKSDYRAGKFDPIRVQSKIAALCVLDDIEAKLTRQVATGQKATATTANQGRHTNDETSPTQ